MIEGLKQVVSPNNVLPELVPKKDFGEFTCIVRDDILKTRVWTFANPIFANKFMQIGHLAKYKRKI
jgi:hypothetical protein